MRVASGGHQRLEPGPLCPFHGPGDALCTFDAAAGPGGSCCGGTRLPVTPAGRLGAEQLHCVPCTPWPSCPGTCAKEAEQQGVHWASFLIPGQTAPTLAAPQAAMRSLLGAELSLHNLSFRSDPEHSGVTWPRF